MLKTGALVLLALWAFGNITRHTLGGFIHALLVLAALLVLIAVIREDKL